MNLSELIEKRDKLSARIQDIIEDNLHLDRVTAPVSTDLLKRQRDALNWQILELQDDESYRLERESRKRRFEEEENIKRRWSERLPKLEDTLKQIREYPWRKI